VCELVSLSETKSCVLSLTESDIVHCVRSEVQRLHGDYGLAVVHLSLRGYTIFIYIFILHIKIIAHTRSVVSRHLVTCHSSFFCYHAMLC